MGTSIRPEVSERNKYWIEKHRYYELKHFCLQYPGWKKTIQYLDGMSCQPVSDVVARSKTQHGDPTARCVEMRDLYFRKMELVEQTAIATDADLAEYILKGVTTGVGYDLLRMMNIPCCKDTYYNLYRRFFWLLDNARNSQSLL